MFEVAHVEAGLRSFDRTMPEEINRVLTDAISDLLFTTERVGQREPARERGSRTRRIHFVGNVMIDTLVHCLSQMPDGLPYPDLRERGYAVVTLHRPSNVDRRETLQAVLRAFQEVSRRLTLVMPLHPRTLKRIDEFGLREDLDAMAGRAVVTEPIGYLDMLRLVKSARMVITDSGGIQEETTYLGVPCLTIGRIPRGPRRSRWGPTGWSGATRKHCSVG